MDICKNSQGQPECSYSVRKKTNTDPLNSTPGYIWKKNKNIIWKTKCIFPNVDSSIIYDCQVMQASVPWQNLKRCDTYVWMDIYVKKEVIWYMIFMYLCVCMWNGKLPSHEKNKNLSLATTWTDLEDIMLREIRWTKMTDTVWYHLYLEYEKKIKQTSGHSKDETDSKRIN